MGSTGTWELMRLSVPPDGIRGGGVVLRFPSLDDVDAILPAFTDPELREAGNLPPFDREALVASLGEMPVLAEMGRLLALAALDAETDEVLGGGTLHHLDVERGIVTPDTPCVADWDSVKYTTTVPHCLRRVDTNLHYPADLNGEVHHDGQIWSRALWDIRNALGHEKADTIILQAQFDMPNPTMPELAQKTVDTAGALYDAPTAGIVRKAFQDRGILS